MAVAPAASDQATPTTARAPDVISDRAAPPLSAISDMPLSSVPRPPTSASNDQLDRTSGIPAEMTATEQAAARVAKLGLPVTKGVTPEAEPTAETPPTTTETKPTTEAKPDVDVSDLAPGTPAWAVREITKARAKQRVAETAQAEAVAKAQEADTLRRELEELRAKPPVNDAAPPPSATEPRPTRDKFETPEAYDEALADWGVKEGKRVAAEAAAATQRETDRLAAEKTEADRKTALEAETARLNESWETKRAAALEKYPDFEEVVYADTALNVPAPMAHAILVAPNGADVAYHLAKNPAEATRIASLRSVGEQLFEMGRLSATLDAPPAVRPRPRIPAPIEPVDGGSNAADTSERELDMEAYAAKRGPELFGNRKPFIMSDPAAYRRQATH